MKIACIGSSSVEGIGDKKGLGWVGRLNNYLQEKSIKVNQYRVYNLGVGGDTLAKTNLRYNSEVLLRNPDLVIIFTGTNDCMRPATYGEIGNLFSTPEKYSLEWAYFLSQLKIAKHKTIILGPTKVDETKGPFKKPGVYDIVFQNSDLKIYNEKLKELCQKKDIPFLEQFDLFDEETIKDNSYDAVHLNEKGYDKVFEFIKDYLENNYL